MSKKKWLIYSNFTQLLSNELLEHDDMMHLTMDNKENKVKEANRKPEESEGFAIVFS